MRYVLIGAFALLVIVVILAIRRYGLLDLVRRAKSDHRAPVVWEDRGPTPLGEKGYTPQGLTFANGKLIFANSWKNERSRVYEIDPETMESQRTFDMAPEAVHTSGLAFDGELLWAVDYKSNQAYAIELEASLAAGEMRERGRFDTTLGGTSACCLVPWDGRTLLAVSDFMRTRRTIFVRPEEALRTGSARDAVVFSYLNEGFSQGLEFIDGELYESNNKLGRDTISRMDLARLRKSGRATDARTLQFDAPAGGVEDLAYDGTWLWTSDETTFRFYRARLPRSGAEAD